VAKGSGSIEQPSSKLIDLSKITALILAGGLGTRLRSVVADRPKVLAQVAGKPWLGRLLDQLVEAGFGRIVLCTGYMADKIKETYGDSYRGSQIIYSEEPSQLGTGGALRYALPQISSEFMLVLNGDSYCEADLNKFCAWHFTREAKASLLLTEVPNASRYGRVQVEDDGRIVGFEEKNQSESPGWINAGVYILERELIESIPEGAVYSLERELYPKLVGTNFFGFPASGKTFIDIGTPESFELAQKIFGQASV